MEFSNENENLVSVEASSTLPLQMFVEKTGNERVDAALDLLQDSSDLSTEEKQLLFEDIHRRLQDTLSDLS
jgi:hypothetical protein